MKCRHTIPLNQLDQLDSCPRCGKSWLGQDILQHFLERMLEHPQKAKEIVEEYYNYSSKEGAARHFKENMSVGVWRDKAQVVLCHHCGTYFELK